jgi:hypothetical protein
MSLFISDKFSEALRHLQGVYEQAIIFGNFMQQGRAANIIGCIHLLNNEINTAEYYFNLSLNLLEKQNADIFSWRPLANLIALYFNRDNKHCYNKINILLNKLRENFEQRISNDKESSVYVMYLAIIYYLNQMHYFDRANEIAGEINNKSSSIFTDSTKMKKFFNCKVKYINNYFCVTG